MTSEHDGVAEHYEHLLAEHGATARGADYRDAASQERRFAQLDRLVLEVGSVCDLGCGYGAYLDHLQAAGYRGSYVGVDLTPGMIDLARSRHPETRLEVGTEPVGADAVVASGIFNVRFGADDEWAARIRRSLATMWAAAAVGIAFNMLSRASSEHLFTVQPEDLAAWLAELGSANVTIDHDVGTSDLTAFVLR